VRLFLVRHGRPVIEPGLLPSAWELDPAHFDDIWTLRESGRLPSGATWFCSPEPKAVATAQLLTEAEVGIVEGLREQVRETADWIDDMDAAVRRAFADPDRSAHPGWEPLVRTHERVLTAVRALIQTHPGDTLVLVGHGTAWTVLAAALTGTEPDLDRWASLGMPDVIQLDLPVASS
jgi:broad specificity phosphatase PhoE